jgi:dTDP-4-dehydrorhamnose reductase
MTAASAIRVLVVGGSGMLGHRAWLALRQRFDTWTTLRSRNGLPAIFDDARVITDVDVTRLETIQRVIFSVQPTVVVNCVGVVKQLASANDPVIAISTNALLPHQLAALCRSAGARFIQISTDCVFSGRKGMYTETDQPDPEDLYGQTKLLGEVTTPGALTIRTSMIGRELRTTSGLVEWLLSHRHGRVEGYRRAIFSGFTTQTLAALIGDVIERHPTLTGLYHVAADPINKWDLVNRLNQRFKAGITIVPSDTVQIDRSLDASRFLAATGMAPPGWDAMIADLAGDPTPYEEWRQTVVS